MNAALWTSNIPVALIKIKENGGIHSGGNPVKNILAPLFDGTVLLNTGVSCLFLAEFLSEF